MDSTPPPSLLPVAAAFGLFGVFWGSWAVATADIEHQLKFSHGAFGLLLGLALVGAAVANVAAGSLTERWGTGPAMRGTLAGWGALLIIAAAVPAPPLAAFIVAFIGVGGAVDAVMNIASAAALAHDPGKLVRFHGLFNVGGAAGALACGLLLHAGVSWRWTWLAAGATACALAQLSRGIRLPADDAGDHHSLSAGLRAVRSEGLLVLCAAFAAAAMVEGALGTWGVLYLRESLASGLILATFAGSAGYLVAAVARIALGPAIGAAGARLGVAVGAGLAAAGLLVMGLLRTSVVVGLGLVAADAGIAVCWPLLIAQASRARERPGVVIGGVTAAGYVGLVIGPAVVGGLASGIGLRPAMLFLATIATAIAVAPSGPHPANVGTSP